MDKGIATVCLSGTLEEKLAAAAEAGFDVVELFEPDLLGCPLTPGAIRARAEALGLRMALYQPFRDFEAVAPRLLAENLRRAEAKFDLMEALGVDLMLVCSNVDGNSVDDDDLAAAQLHQLAERAAAHGLRIAYEALAWGRHVNTYEHSWQIVDDANHPALGVCLDSFHVLSRGSDLGAIRSIPGEKLFFVQLADAPRLAMDVLQWSRHYRCFPGQGNFDLTSFCAQVLAAGYRGPLSLEVFNDVFRRADPRRTAVDAMRSLLVLEDELGVRALPPAPALARFAFAELAVTPASAPEVERQLEALGLQLVGPHRTKPVQLWSAGDAHIVLNHGGPHGEGIVAFAVESADAPRSVERAEALGAPVLARRRQAGEADLAAIAAPDGTSVFFADAGHEWQHDFVPLEMPDDSPRLTIDHLVLPQPFDAFDEAALFYRSLLDLAPTGSRELAAPHGLVRSRAVADVAGHVQLALNVPVLAGPDDAAPQHLAFACADALGLARAVRARGLHPLAIPDNYYDDLAARRDLDDGLLADLRELDVLYDRDEQGELLHFYLPSLGGMFFEALERRGGYRGFGAGNAPVRMAAQERAASSMSPRMSARIHRLPGLSLAKRTTGLESATFGSGSRRR
ncbi:MAG TPA: TIM barrel protein [Solirubrobacteraceae bacterium]|nr:TIM barrel protein [Solirubrobacteraceae bacterium]